LALQPSRRPAAAAGRRHGRRRSRRVPVGAAAPRSLRRDAERDHRRRAPQRARLGARPALDAGALGAHEHGARRPRGRAQPYSASVAREVYDIPDAKLVIVPEPIDLTDWRRRFGEAAGPKAARPTILSVARMYPRKRLEDLLHAAVVLRARIPQAQIRIVGEGPESARLRLLHRELGLGDAVVLLGEVSRSRLAVEYTIAHCFCLPTVQEGFGLVFAEAMAAGLPVVACRAAAVPEIVEDGRTGLLVGERNPAELAQALETLVVNESLRTEFGLAATRRIEAFDLPRVAGRFLETLP